MPQIVRGNQILSLPEESTDPCWNREDRARFLTLYAKGKDQPRGLQLALCKTWAMKFPGLTYPAEVRE